MAAQDQGDKVDNGSIGTFFAILAAVAFIGWAADSGPFASGEVVTYHAACVGKQECKLGEMRPYRETYRADKSTLTVTSWSDLDRQAISLYRSCAVRDKANWVCNIGHDLDLQWPKMADGELRAPDEVPWYQYWWIRLLQIGS
jgi:hypothetical protein